MLPSIGMLPKAEAELVKLGEIGFPRDKINGKETGERDPGYGFRINQNLSFQDGSEAKVLRGNNGFELFVRGWNTSVGTAVYCIEPGTGINTSSNFNADISSITDDFWNSSYSSVVTEKISAAQARQLLGQILLHGYHDNLSIDMSFKDKDQREAIMKAYATQILVWEVVTGERDSSFNSITPQSPYNRQLDRIRDDMPEPAKTDFWHFYHEIEAEVKNQAKNVLPSFVSTNQDIRASNG